MYREVPGVRIPHSPRNESQHVDNETVGSLYFEMLQQKELYAPLSVMDLNRKYPHRKAVLVKGKRWYIKYGMWDETNEKIVTKKWYKGFSSIKSMSEKLAYADYHMSVINRNLPYWKINPIPVEQKKIEPELRSKKDNFTSIREAVEFILELKYQNEGNRKTPATMQSHARLFLDFIKRARLLELKPKDLTKEHVQSYIDFMVIKQSLTGKTVQNRLAGIRAIFSHLRDRGYIEQNVFQDKYDKPKVQKTKKNMAFSSSQIERIKDYAIVHDPATWVLCQIIYYTYLRPIETTRLQLKHILLDQKRIFVPGSISKNRTDAHIIIPDPLYKIFRDMNFGNLNQDLYLLGKDGVPSPEPSGRDLYSKRHKKILNKLNFSSDYTFYSWKHTGVVNAYKNGVDIKSIQLQCRHSSIEQTDTYLKSLGFINNEGFSKGIPSI